METDPTATTGARRLREGFERAMEIAPERRAGWIRDHIADPDLRNRLLRLCAAAESGGALDQPAAKRIERLAVDAERPAAELLGQSFAGFRLVRVIGRGGMATVFLGQREGADFEQLAAVKLLRRGLYSELEQRLFQRERRLLAQLSHPNIARLIDGGVTAASIPFLVLEYVDGEPITRHVERHAQPLPRRLRLMAEACRAVAAAHRALIVHRDLKPANLLVDREGRIKLLDFGIAKLLSETDPPAAAPPTATGLLTPAYAAPEQFDGRPVTMATDVFALGVMLHELVHGRLPGEDEAADARARRHAPPDLERVLRKALARDPAERYPDAAALADDLDSFLSGRPVSAHPPSPWYLARRFVARHRGGVLLSLLLLAGMLGSLAFALWQAQLARQQAARAELQAARAEEVQSFIESLFASVADGEAPASGVSVLQLVEGATARIEQDYPDNPEVRASLLALFARVQSALGNFERNRVLAKDALEANLQVHGLLDERTLDAAFVHGHVLRRLGELDAARVEFETWRDRIRAAGIRGFELARMLDAITMVRMEQGMSGPEAVALKREVTEERERDPALTAEQRATGYNNLGAAYQYAGDLDGALEWYRKALDLNRGLRPDSRQHAVSLLNVGMVQGYTGRWRDAAVSLAAADEVLGRIGLARHPLAVSVATHRCLVLAELDDFASARDSCDRAVELGDALLGASNSATLFARTRRAMAAYAEGRFDAGDADLHQATQALAALDGDRVNSELSIGAARSRGLLARRDAAALREQVPQWRALWLQSARQAPSPAELMLEAGLAWACAEAAMQACTDEAGGRAAALLASPRYAASAQRLAARVTLAQAALVQGRPAEAVQWLDGIEGEFSDALEPGHSLFGMAWLALAQAADASGDPGRAAAMRRRAEVIAATLPATHPLRVALGVTLR